MSEVAEAAETTRTAQKAEARRMDVPTATRQPFEFDEALAGKIRALGLGDTVRQLKEEGYGYIHDVAGADFNGRLREALLRVSKDGMDAGEAGYGANMLLDKDPVVTEAVLNPKILAIVEVMCGQGALITQVASSVKPPGGPQLGLHADQNWTPAPFPVHNQLVTFCWATDDFSKENGSTRVVPKSHLLGRHPTTEEAAAAEGAIATECPAGSVVVWGGATWHGSASRTNPGERVVVHISYARLAMRPIENYDHLDDEWLADQPYEMRVLLGREDFLNSRKGAYGGGPEALARTFTWAKT